MELCKTGELPHPAGARAIFCIVVARYNENLDWTKPYPNVIVYNKGSPLSTDFNQIFLHNVGREGHTYFKHIYDNYHNLADYTIFLQGNPFDHSPNIISNLNNIFKRWHGQPQARSFCKQNTNIDFEFLSERILDCNLSGCRHHGGLPLIETYEKLFDERKENMVFKFGAGAQFIVSKERILKRPQEFYLKIVQMLERDINPIEGFVIERFHKLIFS